MNGSVRRLEDLVVQQIKYLCPEMEDKVLEAEKNRDKIKSLDIKPKELVILFFFKILFFFSFKFK